MGCGTIKGKQIEALEPIPKTSSEKVDKNKESKETTLKESEPQTKASAIQTLPQKAKSLEERIAKTPWLSQSFLLTNVENLGEGSFGKVFGVIWKKTNKRCALKYIFVQDEDEFASMEKEINLLMELRQFGNVVQILDKHIVANSHELYILMEKGDCNLKQYIDKNKNNISFDIILQFFADICYGLNKAHNIRIIHSDIKPGNILVFENTNRAEVSNIQNFIVSHENLIFKLTDWGAGCSNSTGKTTRLKTGMAFTTAYAAPEVLIDEEKINFEKADIYSLGMTFLNFCGIKFDDMRFISGIAKPEKHDREIAELLEDVPKKYNSKLKDFLTKMLKFDRHERIDLDKAIELLQEIKPNENAANKKLEKKKSQNIGPNPKGNDVWKTGKSSDDLNQNVSSQTDIKNTKLSDNDKKIAPVEQSADMKLKVIEETMEKISQTDLKNTNLSDHDKKISPVKEVIEQTTKEENGKLIVDVILIRREIN